VMPVDGGWSLAGVSAMGLELQRRFTSSDSD
jgi:hypothetical protein